MATPAYAENTAKPMLLPHLVAILNTRWAVTPNY